MLLPIATWTSRSLQFQPPDTKPSGVSRQPFRPRIARTTRATAAAMIHAGASSRSARPMLRGTALSGGSVTGVSDGSRIRAMTTVAIASSAAATRTAARPKPSSSATNLTVCADRYTLVTTATPAAPGPRQVRGDASDDDPARDGEQPRPDGDDPESRHEPRQQERAGEPEEDDGDGRRRQGIDPEPVVGGWLH